ncbi:MAG: hypothetical protein HRU49_11025 [Winogradskyella sp.]|uniref:hypothetical protein n=1 Tax=Winogradskyella sp. TaxID=1883156 RepID=UPI0025EF2787|nr:hypothetical protein [Winogradskyella sp.]NRB84289.1 hypothetical protein [Winogradskyella sp.]
MRIFKEQQRFNQLWLILLMFVSLLVPIALTIGTYIKNPDQFTALEFTLIIVTTLLAPCLIFIFKLSTRIDQEGIQYKFFPFHLKFKHIQWNEIDKAYIRKYDALTEYGGWGIKGGAFWKKDKGTAVNVSGDIGIQLELKNGKKLLIGTQLKNESEMVLQTYQTKINNNG